MAKKEEETIVTLKALPGVIKGVYVTSFSMGTSSSLRLLLLDGVFTSPGANLIVSRLLIPLHVAKVLAKEMNATLKAFEKEYGKIEEMKYEVSEAEIVESE